MSPQLYTGGSVATNGYLMETPHGLIVIDAPKGITERVRATARQPLAVLLTHHHFDHVEDAAELARMGASIHAFAPWDPELTLAEAAQRWGFPITIEPYTVDRVLKGEATLSVADETFELMHIPGHSPDSLVFHLPSEGLAFGGDTLFAGSIGRTDLPGGRHRDLLEGLRTKLLTLPPGTRILPGHGPETTIQQELVSNPYLE